MSKVIFYLHASGLCGGIRVVCEYVSRLNDVGVDAELWTPVCPKFSWHKRPLRHRMFNSLDELGRVARETRAHKVATWWETANWVAETIRLGDRGFYLTQDIETTYSSSPVQDERILATYQLGLTPLPTSRWVEEQLVNVVKSDRPPVFVGLGIDLDTYAPLPMAREQQRIFTPFRPQAGPNDLKGWFCARVAADFCRKIEPKTSLVTFNLYGGPSDVPEGMPHIHVNGASDMKLRELYSQAGVFLMASNHEGFGLCVHPDTVLETDTGDPVMIKDIAAGDAVMMKNGQYGRVAKVVNRHVKKAISVRVSLGRKVIVSHEHPFLVSKHKHGAKTHPLEWRRADQIDKGTLVAIPKSKLDAPLIKSVDLSCIGGIEYDDNSVWFKMGFSPESKESMAQLASRFSETRAVIEFAIKRLRNPLKIRRNGSRALAVADKLAAEKFIPNEPKKYNRFMKITDGFLLFAGWYLAEGSANASIQLSCGDKDEPHLTRVFSWIREECGGFAVVRNGRKFNVNICHGILARWLPEMFGNGAYNKRIPQWLFESGEKLENLIRGLIMGDGHITRVGSIKYSTMSKTLGHQVRAILSSWSIASSLIVDERGLSVVSISGTMAIKLAERIGLDIPINKSGHKTKRVGSSAIDVGEYMLVPVRNIEEIDYDGLLYDISVPESKSFVGNGLVLHNTALEAMACGCPVVMTDCDGNREYLMDGLNCLSANRGESSKLGEHCAAIMQDATLANRLSMAGLETANEYTWGKAIARMKAALA